MSVCAEGGGGLPVGARGGGLILFLGDYERGEGSMGQRIMQIKTERLTNGRIMAAAGQGQLLCGNGAAADESMCLERAQVTHTRTLAHANRACRHS